MKKKDYILNLCKNAKDASLNLIKFNASDKNEALLLISNKLTDNIQLIISENEKDLIEGKKNKLSSALLDRLKLNEERIISMSDALVKIAKFPDPIGEIEEGWKTETGLWISKVRVPIGVIAMIYESRPNVTIDAASLAIKSSNAIILRGGKEAIYSNKILAKLLREAIKESKLPNNIVQLIEYTDRAMVSELIRAKDYVDCIIPRGGKGLKNAIVENAKVPVIITGAGLCHVYVDEFADKNKVVPIVLNAKTQRTGVCNAIESLLIHSKYSIEYKKEVIDSLIDKNVEVVGCERTRKLNSKVGIAKEEDYATEYLDMKISVKIVDSIDEAINHINTYGTKHSESIITESVGSSERFLNEIDASTVYLNASTRFTDGSEFGFGGEIGISTQKLHARGPMGVKALTTTKYVVRGNGNIR
ncbi:glutamate-5-semialdehyde dehydrogenase [Helicovermis profundi]|uniref:Gamma-glutamyl phosphate reductase n=1 Tax=Helicovermis profundi TaxID=3065157 RepID=A0AAU9E6G3_9FIRM|nr:glutamate-5-semialdehyde dehydrogenase [Clostridia bacterium S502]